MDRGVLFGLIAFAFFARLGHPFPMRTRPDILTKQQLPDGPVLIDEYRYLTDPDLWTPAFAHHAAQTEGVSLTDSHFAVLSFMRDWLETHGVIPDVRFVLKFIAGPDSITKAQSKDALYTLFSVGYVKQACKIAGMKQPRAWSTG